jgi:thiol:disulfide interchange protein DsbD
LSSLTAEPVEVSIYQENQTIEAGKPFWVATELKLEEGWHTYWKNPGGPGMAPKIEWSLPEGFTLGRTIWPTPQRFSLGDVVGYGYEKEMVLLTEVIPPKEFKSLNSLPLKAQIEWLSCSHDTCLPGSQEVALEITLGKSEVLDPKNGSLFEKARSFIPKEIADLSLKETVQGIVFEFADSAPDLSALFFPEDSSHVPDHDFLKTTRLAQGKHALELKALQVPKVLKGVLVVENQGKKEAYHIEKSVESLPQTPSHAEFEGGVGMAILLAFIGGAILNLMPCVLPVLSFKVLSFVKMAGESRSKTLAHGLSFSFGVLVSFWTIAALLLTLQAYGSSVGWGFQLQEPLFVGALAAVLFLFGLSLFGVFEMGTSLASKASQAQGGKKEGLFASFFSGILATAVATPCTGPFLGSAVGFAVTQPPFQSMMIFTSLGLGMAAPYLLLAGFPKLLKFMPKPGAWMETFKELMGFLMLASVLWLVWVFGAQTNSLAVFFLLISFFLLAIGGWIFGKWGTPVKKKATRLISYALSLVCIGGAVYSLYTSTTPWVQGEETVSSQKSFHEGWEPFNPERIAELQAQGIPVFVDFTAKWCLICQTNHLSLSTKSVEEEFKNKKVVKMKADWTKRDPVITAELKKFGRSGVPLYVLYSGDAKRSPQVLPQVLTPDVVIDYVEKEQPHIAIQKAL